MSLSNAWEVTSDDVAAVMAESGREVSMDEADAILARHVAPHFDSVAKAALRGDGLDEQAEAARGRIREILTDAGVVGTAPAP